MLYEVSKQEIEAGRQDADAMHKIICRRRSRRWCRTSFNIGADRGCVCQQRKITV